MVETRPKWFQHGKRMPLDSIVRRVDQMEGSQIISGKEDLEKLLRKNLEINELDREIYKIEHYDVV
jgi:hypothetical protein